MAIDIVSDASTSPKPASTGRSPFKTPLSCSVGEARHAIDCLVEEREHIYAIMTVVIDRIPSDDITGVRLGEVLERMVGSTKYARDLRTMLNLPEIDEGGAA